MLLMHTIAHPSVNVVSQAFVEGIVWKTIFWSVMFLIALGGWFLSKEKQKKQIKFINY